MSKSILYLSLFALFCMFLISNSVNSAVTQEYSQTTSEGIQYSSSTWADVNGDGFVDLLGSTDDMNDVNSNGIYGRVHCFDVHNNTLLWTYSPNPPSIICSTPTVADLDGDEDMEIIFGVGYTSTAVPGRVYIIDHQGNYVWHYEPYDMNGNGVPDGVYSTAAVGDLNRDGLLDFVIASFDQRIYAFAYNQTFSVYYKMWEFMVGDTIYASPALANIDDDPYLEVMIGIPTHLEVDTTNTDFTFNIEYDGGMMVVLNHDGSLHPDFLASFNPNKPKTYTTQTIRSSAAVADIDGDDRFEIIHTTSAFRGGFHGRCGPSSITPIPQPEVYAWNHDGTAAWNPWPSLGTAPANACDSTVINDSETSPAIGDIDLDGLLEVVVGQRSHNGTAQVWVLNGEDGSDMSPYPMLLTNRIGNTPSVGIRSSPVITSVDGDSYPDIFFPILDDVMILDYLGYSISGSTCLNSGGISDCLYSGGQLTYQNAGIWDFDCDYVPEVGVGIKTGNTGQYTVWDMDIIQATGCDEAPGTWSMFRQNQYHTGLYDVIPPATVNDLNATRLSTDTIELDWTAPGHNNNTGCAFLYEIRYCVNTSFDWDTGTHVSGVPLPEVAGTSQSVVVSSVPQGNSYTFALKTSDEVPNTSAQSNLATEGGQQEVETLMLDKASADILLSWTHLTGIDLYNVMISSTPNGTFTVLQSNVGSPVYHVNAVNDGQDHYYYIEVP